MVQSSAEDAFAEDLFAPDGGYFPRILFFDAESQLMDKVVQREDKYKYFHFGAESIVKSMREALVINERRTSKIEL